MVERARCPRCGAKLGDPSPVPLTPKQADALRVICEIIDREGIPPTLRELARELDIASYGHAHGIVATLVEKGWIARAPGRARDLRVLFRLPPAAEPAGALVLTRRGLGALKGGPPQHPARPTAEIG